MFLETWKHHSDCFDRLRAMAAEIEEAGTRLAQTIGGGHKVLVCGNGGSAADAQHFAAELIGRFERERSAWPAVALTTDTSILTAVGNDYGFADIFSRQVQGLGTRGDALIGISTSGNSENVLRAAAAAKSLGMSSVGLLGRDGGRLKGSMDCSIVIAEKNTARIQEMHIFILHFWALIIEQRLADRLKR